MLLSLSQRAYVKWQLYWEAEPWGPWRDNMHMAMLAREIRRPQVRRGSTIELDWFMVRQRRVREREQNRAVLGFLRAIAEPREVSDGDRSS